MKWRWTWINCGLCEFLLHQVVVLTDYLTDFALSFSLQFPNGENRCVAFGFFGKIDTGSVTVQLRGLVIIVTMTKLLTGPAFNWPRLLATKQPARWLKYYQKFEGVDDAEIEPEFLIVPPEDKDYEDSDERADIEHVELDM